MWGQARDLVFAERADLLSSGVGGLAVRAGREQGPACDGLGPCRPRATPLGCSHPAPLALCLPLLPALQDPWGGIPPEMQMLAIFLHKLNLGGVSRHLRKLGSEKENRKLKGSPLSDNS